MKDDIKRSWEGLIKNVYFNYHGVSTRRSGSGYIAFDKYFERLSLLKEEIERRGKIIEKSIIK